VIFFKGLGPAVLGEESRVVVRLEHLNMLAPGAATREFLRCCGSTRWAQSMAAARPFSTVEQMAETADAIWSSLERTDWLEAFAAHPRIAGGPSGLTHPAHPAHPTSLDWSEQEQSGTQSANDAERQRLAAGNREYEARFGYIFIVCATGKSAADMLVRLEHRLRNDRAQELVVAAGEQRKITRLRLTRLLDE
jgi:2-oxo-4-hydroxy-4-carboxy-5-ureidoimidazoline decarboxylase